jgi:3-hydroxymyristoyl/3-hydroxydecanoyl-(acyl carrier protein) dehydratase
VDSISERVAGERIVGQTTFLPGPPLAPGWPFVPEVLVLEALTQISGLILVPDSPPEEAAGPRGGFLAAASQVRFGRLLKAGEPLTLRSRLDLRLGSAARFRVEAELNGDLVAEGTVTLGGIQGA